MELMIYTILDVKVETFMRPTTARSDGDLIRGLIQESFNENSMLSKYPYDFTVYQVGTFDEETGAINPVPLKEIGNLGVIIAKETRQLNKLSQKFEAEKAGIDDEEMNLLKEVEN